LIKQAAEHIVS